MDFVVAGPGARDGIRKCFGSSSAGREREVIEYMALSQDEHFDPSRVAIRRPVKASVSVAVPRLSQMTTTGQISGVTLLLVGSFAPPHSGHMAVVSAAANLVSGRGERLVPVRSALVVAFSHVPCRLCRPEPRNPGSLRPAAGELS
jgi:hypothetical protein